MVQQDRHQISIPYSVLKKEGILVPCDVRGTFGQKLVSNFTASLVDVLEG